MYTSGTTGTPKGVMLTQATSPPTRASSAPSTRWAPRIACLAVLPLYHINAFAVTMLAPLAHGGSLAMPPKFSAGRFWDLARASSARGSTWCPRS
jgi:acyl-CoA synthetase (AMP-forming)/AMP-acid ligase II